MGCFLIFLPAQKSAQNPKTTLSQKPYFSRVSEAHFSFSVPRPRDKKKGEDIVSPFGRWSPEDALLDVGALESFDVSLELSTTTTQRGVGSRSEVHGTLER